MTNQINYFNLNLYLSLLCNFLIVLHYQPKSEVDSYIDRYIVDRYSNIILNNTVLCTLQNLDIKTDIYQSSKPW